MRSLHAAALPLLAFSLACGAPVCPGVFARLDAFPATCTCPAEAPNPVYGTDRYGAWSGICEAAGHAGASAETVTVYAYDDCDVFVGIDRNGFASKHSGEPGASYGFVQTAPECPSPFDIELGSPSTDDAATCDDAHGVDEICKRAQDGTDNPQWFTYIDGTRLDCPCREITIGLGGLIPRAFRPRGETVSLEGVTPLQAAVGLGHESEVRYLLEHGASPEAGTVRPLQVALGLEGTDVARPRIALLLKAAGADVKGLDFSICEDGASKALSCAVLEERIGQ